MEYDNLEEYIIKKYQQDESVMIQLFVGWALNNQLDPVLLYQRAYPSQAQNKALAQAVEQRDFSDTEISDETLLDLLQMFGNDDLAFVASEEMEKINNR